LPLRDALALTAEQKKQLDMVQKETDNRLAQALSEEQKKQLKEAPTPGPGGRGGMASEPGQIMSMSVQSRLKLTPEQRKLLQELQKEADGKLDKLLVDEQKRQLKEMRA